MSPIPLGIFAASGAGAVATDFELIQSTVLSSTTTSITFSSIPATYTHLQLRVVARRRPTDGASIRDIHLRINGVTGINAYESGEGLRAIGSTIAGLAPGDLEESIEINDALPGDSFSSSSFGVLVIDIPDYRVAKRKHLKVFKGIAGATGSVSLGGGRNAATTTITSIALLNATASDHFAIGSRFSLYGIKG